MTFEDFAKKFRGCASHSAVSLPDDQLERVIEITGRLEEIADVGEIMRLLT